MHKLNSASGGGGCYIDFRASNPPDLGVELTTQESESELLADYKNVKYVHHYSLTLRDSKYQTETWTHLVPYPTETVSDFSAHDKDGHLMTRKTERPGNARHTLLEVTFRRPIDATNPRYAFTFEYASPIESIISNGFLGDSVTFYDWMIQDTVTQSLKQTITLPKGAVIRKFIPNLPSEQRHNPIILQAGNIPANGLLSYMVSFSTRRLGSRFAVAVGSLFGTALLGALLRTLIEALLKKP